MNILTIIGAEIKANIPLSAVKFRLKYENIDYESQCPQGCGISGYYASLTNS